MHKNHKKILRALAAYPEPALDFIADRLIALGAKSEWDMDDNFITTEGLAGLAEAYDLPKAGNQMPEALKFYGKAALSLGYSADIEE